MLIRCIIRPLLLIFIINSITVYTITVFFDSIHIEGGMRGYLIAGGIIALLNILVKPLLKIVSIPFLFFSMGLFIIVINGVILYLLQYIMNGLRFEGVALIIEGSFVTYLFAAIIFATVNWGLSFLLKSK